MRVKIEVEETELEGDYRDDIPGIIVKCSRCEHSVEVFGTEDASIRRGCVMLKEECPRKEKNFYFYEEPHYEDDTVA